MVQLSPRVSGHLVTVNVQDNQQVKKGDLLFQIDPEPYQLAVDQAKVALALAREGASAMEADVRAAEAMIRQRKAAVETAQKKIEEVKLGIVSADSVVKEAEAGVTYARAVIEQVRARSEEAIREAARARQLSDSRAGAVATAEAREAAAIAVAAQLKSAEAGLTQAQASLEKAKTARDEADLRLDTAKSSLIETQTAIETTVANRDKASAALGETGDANQHVRQALVAVERAELNLKWTAIYAPADGYITNMNLQNDTLVTQGHPFALFVDSSSFRVDAYFQETKLKNIAAGDKVMVTIMGHKHQKIEGEVESIGFAINPPRIAATEGPANLVPTIAPTFEWIRLAQRVPVRIKLKDIPDDLHLVSGMTASVAIRK
ncbi:HlyD family secretion protein [Fuerstiella marisgermanici]|nr:HlyD family secretion protein [Fuerstiella marisgermanici]